MQMNFSIFKSRLRVFLATLLYFISRLLPSGLLPVVKGKTRVLVFHHIENAQRFEAIIKKLSKNYRIIDFAQYLAGDKAGDKLNIIIALDDGYFSWYQNALPIFRKYNVCPLLFVCSDFVGLSPNAAKEFCSSKISTWPETSMSWANLVALREIGAEVGGHTLDHIDLTMIKDERDGAELLDTIISDRENLSKQLGLDICSFAYPYGRYNSLAIKTVEKAGYNFGFTCDSGYLEESHGPLLLKRTNIGLRPPIAVCAAAEGWLDFLSVIVKLLKRKIS